MIGAQIIAAFELFKRPITYIRENDQISTYGFIAEADTASILAGDMEQVESVLTMTVDDMMTAGIFPPHKYDRVIFNGDSHAVILPPRVQYDGEQPLLCRIRCKG